MESGVLVYIVRGTWHISIEPDDCAWAVSQIGSQEEKKKNLNTRVHD